MIARTREAYEAAFAAECERSYPVIDAFEARLGYAIDRLWLEAAASLLACPVKKNPPCWQHGRVLYALARDYLAHDAGGDVFFLDIGTAKGFSACVLAKAIADAGRRGRVASVDKVDPDARVERNTIADLDGLYTVAELVAPYRPDAVPIEFHGGGADILLGLMPLERRIHFAFVDGKHDFIHVMLEAGEILKRQGHGDIAVFDDVHLPAVLKAARRVYDNLEIVPVLNNRAFGIARRL